MRGEPPYFPYFRQQAVGTWPKTTGSVILTLFLPVSLLEITISEESVPSLFSFVDVGVNGAHKGQGCFS